MFSNISLVLEHLYTFKPSDTAKLTVSFFPLSTVFHNPNDCQKISLFHKVLSRSFQVLPGLTGYPQICLSLTYYLVRGILYIAFTYSFFKAMIIQNLSYHYLETAC